MEFSKKSWHYLLNKLYFSSVKYGHTVSLCKYFWMTVCSIFASLIFLLFAIIVTSILVSPYVNFIDYIFGLNLNFYTKEAIYIGFTFNFIFGFVVISVFVKEWYIEYREKNPKFKSFKEPNILISFIKAKKSKICPMIEFKD